MDPKPCLAISTSSCFIEKNMPRTLVASIRSRGLDRVVDERVGVVASVDARTVDRDIETSAFTGSDLDRVADGVLVMYVGDDVLGLTAGLAHELDGLLQGGCGPAGDGDRVARGC
jgi:hypothetical protein